MDIFSIMAARDSGKRSAMGEPLTAPATLTTATTRSVSSGKATSASRLSTVPLEWQTRMIFSRPGIRSMADRIRAVLRSLLCRPRVWM